MNDVETSGKSTTREYFEALLIAVIFVNFARIFIFQAFKIPTGSMVDNLLVGDHIIVNKFIYGDSGRTFLRSLFGFREVQRGDIVVFRFPQEPDTDFVKRVIGLPGETITIRNKHVYVDGVPIEEPYVLHDDPQVYARNESLPEPYRSRDQFGPYVVPDHSYFVMGDNRDRSNDSRYWGAVRRELIKGRAFLVYWSYRGLPPPPGSPPTARIRELLGVLAHFVSKTRWDRTFLVIDSKYHYQERAEGSS